MKILDLVAEADVCIAAGHLDLTETTALRAAAMRRGVRKFLCRRRRSSSCCAILKEAGGDLDDVVKVTVFLRNMAHFKEVHEARGRYFRPPYPASSMVEVSRLVEPGHLIEIEAIAVLG